MKLMVWNAARGGMRTVVEGYAAAGFLDRETIRLVAAYEDAKFWRRQAICLRALALFTALLCRHDIELVHIHTATRGSFWRKALFATIARLFRTPIVLHLHGSDFAGFYHRQPGPVRALIRQQLEWATGVIVLSESWRAAIAAIAPAARMSVVPNAVTLPPVSTLTDRPQSILFLGRIGARKGAFDLIAAFATIAPRYPALSLTLAGDGQTAEARDLAHRLGLADRITVLNWVDDTTRSGLLAWASIYALPSYNEGLPMSVLEAMAAGLPVIATPVGGIPDLIETGKTGLLVPSGDIAALAAALATLLNDPELSAALGSAARDRIGKAFTPEIVLPTLSALYAKYARRRSPGTLPLRAID